MEQQELQAYIKQKLADLDKQKDMQEIVNKGKLSFGIDSTTYGHLPAWNDLVKRKKQMMKMVWVNAFYVSLMTVFIVGDFWEKFEQHWVKALLGVLTLAGLIMLIYVIVGFYSIFYQFRQTEREVRRLIYQDILHQLKKTEKETV